MSVASLERFFRQLEGKRPLAVSHCLQEEAEGRFAFYLPTTAKIDTAALVDRIEGCLPHLAEIFRSPYVIIKDEYHKIRADLADSLSPQGIQMTLRDTRAWKMKNGRLVPEYVYARSREDEYNTYENRVVRALVDKIVRFLNLPLEYSKEGIRNLYDAYFQHTALNKLDLVKLIDDDLFKSSDVRSFVDYKKLFYLRARLSQFRSGAFYKIMSRFASFAGQPEATNLFVHNGDYQACFRLWMFLDEFNAELSLFSQAEQKSVYAAFVTLAMAWLYTRRGFKIVKDALVKEASHDFSLRELVLESPEFRVRIDADTTRVSVLVRNLRGNTQQKTLIGLHTDLSEEFPKGNQFVVSLHRTDYSDHAACVDPGNKGSLKNLESIVRCTIFTLEAEKEIYDKLCLICGSNALEDKEFYYKCPDCKAVYSFPDPHTVWLNQFNVLLNREEKEDMSKEKKD